MAKEALFKQSNAWRKIVATFFKTNGVWKQATPFIKVDGEWIEIGESVDREFHLYFGIAANLRKYDTEGNAVWNKPSSLGQNITEITVDPQNIYTGHEWGYLTKWDSEGNEMWQTSFFADSLYALAVDAEEYIYGGSGIRLQKRDANGDLEWNVFPNTSGTLTSIAVDVFGHVYVGWVFSSGIGRGYQISASDGSVLGQVGISLQSRVANVVTSPSGHVYLAGYSDRRIEKVDQNRNTVWTYQHPTSSGNILYDISIDKQENIYAVVDNSVFKLDSDGDLKWESHFSAGFGSRWITVTPNNEIFMTTSDGYLFRFDSEGNEIWNQRVAGVAAGYLMSEPGPYGAFPSHW